MSLTVLSVAYPLAPVGPDAVGGAEQVLSALDRALVAAGHRSVVVACEGSETAGELVAVPAEPGPYDAAALARAHARHRAAIRRVLAREAVDVAHLHGIDFHRYLPDRGPTLATLHLPLDWYPPEAWSRPRPDLRFNCVSASQERTAPAGLPLLPAIPNGVDPEAFRTRHARRRFALFLGRICPEKGVHLALEAAERAGVPLAVAGRLYPYAAHVRYFEASVAPRLGDGRRFVGPLGLARKRRFLSAARCLLLPSLAAETSSLVAMEALACGTPVIGFAAGALPEIVEHGETGFIVEDAIGMAEAIRRADEIDPEACRRAARERFPLRRTVEGYMAAYRALARAPAGAA